MPDTVLTVGSSDGSSELLDDFHAANPATKVVHLSRNFGEVEPLQPDRLHRLARRHAAHLDMDGS